MNRQPKGVRTGGQFATDARSDDIDDLADPGNDWGATPTSASSPWGAVQTSDELAPGVLAVSTAGHGGLKLSAERNRAVHPALRQSNGWYEEDDEANIVAHFHPDVYPDADREQIAQRLRDNWPEEWEQATGEQLTADTSEGRARQLWQEEHQGEMATTWAAGTDDGDVEVGLEPVGHDRRVSGEPATETWRVDRDTYRRLKEQSPTMRVPVSELEKAGATKTASTEANPPNQLPGYDIDIHTLSPSARKTALNDLSKMYRIGDTVYSLNEMINDGMINGKKTTISGGRRGYELTMRDNDQDSSYTPFPVSKTTWDAFGAPDERTPQQVAHENLRIAEHEVEKTSGGRLGNWMRSTAENNKAAKAKEKLQRARAAYQKFEEETS